MEACANFRLLTQLDGCLCRGAPGRSDAETGLPAGQRRGQAAVWAVSAPFGLDVKPLLFCWRFLGHVFGAPGQDPFDPCHLLGNVLSGQDPFCTSKMCFFG